MLVPKPGTKTRPVPAEVQAEMERIEPGTGMPVPPGDGPPAEQPPPLGLTREDPHGEAVRKEGTADRPVK